jgi:hypothetical protein
MRSTFQCVLLTLAIMTALPVSAQGINSPPQFSDRDAKGAIMHALRMLPKVNCGGKRCAPPTPEEFATPPVRIEDARLALLTAVRSAQLAWCGLDWQTRTHTFMMRIFAQKYGSNVRAIALLRLIHAVQQGRIYTNLQVLKTCTPRVRAELDEQNPSVVQSFSHQIVEQMLRDDSVKRMLQLVLDRMPQALCGPKKKCAPATPEEKANPPVSVEDARQAMTAGVMSGTAQHCGLDWKRRVFAPMMAYHRKKAKMSDRQLAMMSLLHGSMQGYMLAGYRKRGEACTPKVRADLEKRLSAPDGKPKSKAKPKPKPKSKP